MDVKTLHVEASTFCNARCPLCPRNIHGLNVPGVYPEVHLNKEKFKSVINRYPNLEWVYFNGNLGDPMMNPHIEDLISLVQCRTTIFTNGSIGRKETWEWLARQGTEVTFSIDGLEDTNHLYRQDVNWDRLMERVGWFIKAGGKAGWKWIVFKHNNHQIDEARKMSERMGFKFFGTIEHGRDYGPVLNKQAEITHWILPQDGSKLPEEYDVKAAVERYKNDTNNYPNYRGNLLEIDCDEHETQQKVYVDAHGRVSPCCYQGFDLPNRKRKDISDFPKLKQEWGMANCDSICAFHCGRELGKT